MKIMLLVSSMHGGGAERVAATLVNAWAARGDIVTLVPTYSGRGTCFYALSEQVRLIWLADQPGARGRWPWRGAARLRALRDLIREQAPDVLVSFLTNVNVAALLAARGQGVPVIVSERTNPTASTAAGPWLRLLRRLLYPRADTVVVQTQDAQVGIKRLMPRLRHLAVIPNPLPHELMTTMGEARPFAPAQTFAAAAAASSACALVAPAEPVVSAKAVAPAESAKGVAPAESAKGVAPAESAESAKAEAPAESTESAKAVARAEPAVSPPGGPRKRLAAMGRLVPHKQFDLLVDVFARLAGDFPAWDLWIWGDGPDHAVLRQRAAAAGLDQRVLLPGRTSEPWQELAAAHAFVLSSAVEGFPNALLEAMALGLPCAAFDCRSGPRTLMEHGRAGLLVPAGDRAALETALRQLLADTALRASLGARAAASVRGRFGLPAVLASWDNVFAQVRRRRGTLPPGAKGAA